MVKRIYQKTLILLLITVFMFTSFSSAYAGDFSDLWDEFESEEEPSAELTVDSSIFTEDKETLSVTINDEELSSLALVDAETDEWLSVIAEDLEKGPFEWDLHYTEDDEDKRLKDGIYYLALTNEPVDTSQDIELDDLSYAAIVQKSEQPSIELNQEKEDGIAVLEENNVSGEVESALFDFGVPAAYFEISYVAKKDGEPYTEGTKALNEDHSFTLENELTKGLSSLQLTVTDPAELSADKTVDVELTEPDAAKQEENESSSEEDEREEDSSESNESNENADEQENEENASETNESSSNEEENEVNAVETDETTDLEKQAEDSEENSAREEENTRAENESESNEEENEENAVESDENEDTSFSTFSTQSDADQNEETSDYQTVSAPPYQDGDKSDNIREMKQDLTKLGFGNFPDDPSNRYGPVTEGVVEDFQRYYGLSVTGEAGDTTLQRLDNETNTVYQDYHESSSFIDMKNMLTELDHGNFPDNPSRNYGPVTAGVVEEFQAAENLHVTGIADSVTLALLEERHSEETENSDYEAAAYPPYADGDQGAAIREMKLDLTHLGFGNFPSDPSVRYGPVTEGVVEQFQAHFGLDVTGVADNQTLNYLETEANTIYQDYNVDESFQEMKEMLTELGYGNFPENPSANYGPVTAGVVEEFQTAEDSLVTNGIADSITLALLEERYQAATANNGYEPASEPPYADGDQGDAIREMKISLTKLGFGNFPEDPSIRYGPVTEGVVSEFQAYFGLTADGIADQTTLNRLDDEANTIYQDRHENESFVAMKTKLEALGHANYSSAPSDVFGPNTASVVKRFQASENLKETGIADSVTLEVLDDLYQQYQQNEPTAVIFNDGDRNGDVRDMKLDLTKLGFGNFPSDPSEAYGPVTMGVVESFQNYYGVSRTDGVTNRETLSTLESVLNSPYSDGNSGPYVKEMKLKLTQFGFGNFPNDPSENYGPVTAGVVKDFQAANGLKVNGIADGPTLEALENQQQETIQQGIVTATALNVRSGPSTDYSRVGSLPNGEIVDIQQEESNGWYRILFGDGQAYVSGLHIDLYDNMTDGEIIGYVTANSTLNVRSGPGTSHDSIDRIPSGAEVEILHTHENGRNSSWHEIRYDGNQTGYVSAGYIELERRNSASSGPLAGKTIYLDPGHGGSDPGGIGGGMLEKEIALDVSLRTEQELVNAGAEVVMARRTDFFLSLSQRAFQANRSDADIFVSVHANISGVNARGTETFWYPRYAATDSERLAHSLQDSVVEALGTHYRRVDQGNFHVIRETEIPSALLELGFMDNEEDAAKLRSDYYRDRAAGGILNGLVDYFN
ncbi:peptidoglycan-binding protein [Salisediminibacterium halotolerans]|uniref:peptidoglycan-binding protein n=1 Tax=Salisediminibacterium halotolerans TaxID=517425 RepID=UPI0015A53421|nr:peptidoglycan-binding protein [Salisediminibacterium haloalkalitolerans]